MCFTTRTSRLAFLPVSTKQQWLVQSKRSTPTANQSAMALSGSTAVCCDRNYRDYTQKLYFGQWKIYLSQTGELLEDVRLVLVNMLHEICRNY